MDIRNDLSNEELVHHYGDVILELRRRGIIRSKNVVGDLGEYLAIDYYNKTKGLPKLQPAPKGTENIDAISTKGDRYSIKSTTGSTASVFYGLNPPGSIEPEKQKFVYVILVLLDENYVLKQINEVTWEQFHEFKRWHSRMTAWQLTATKKLLANTRVIFKAEE